MVPLVCAVFDWTTQTQLLSIGLAASCAGGVCGDHLSPISDTTIMASAGAHCYHLNHVATQIPYGVTVAAVSFVSFIIAGLVQNVVVCMIIAIVLMIVTLLVIKAIVSKKHAGIFEEMAAADKVLYNTNSPPNNYHPHFNWRAGAFPAARRLHFPQKADGLLGERDSLRSAPRPAACGGTATLAARREYFAAYTPPRNMIELYAGPPSRELWETKKGAPRTLSAGILSYCLKRL